ncbi:hypothetical protein [Frankia sp. AvcI1]|uniref:hypothetical protein n=1 Tax=Frankia sp. AvcI1 TaxID=573496 RepID=UPI0006EBFC99|nr:hypothetical protein [Frankia sp. AvcI1]
MNGRQQTRPTRVEITETGVEVYAPFSQNLNEDLRSIPGARWIPAHWEVPTRYQAEIVEFLDEIFGPPTVVYIRRPGQ